MGEGLVRMGGPAARGSRRIDRCRAADKGIHRIDPEFIRIPADSFESLRIHSNPSGFIRTPAVHLPTLPGRVRVRVRVRLGLGLG